MNEHSMNNAVTMRPQAGASLGRIDQYELIRELGGGGFGCVYLARDTVAGIEVAVKGLPPLVRLNKEELENVRKNFALVSRLHHPNIAAALHLQKVEKAFYDDKSDAEKLRVFSGDTLVVMQYAPGVTLSQWRKQFPDGKVPLDKAIEITRQIASALDYAHKERIVHRDIKPANVMIETLPDRSVTARVLDFGLAAEIRSSMGRLSLNVTDKSGTRHYMAPEQWSGKKQSKETDQYSLAALFYELILGEVSFASVFDTGDTVLMKTVVENDSPEIPSDLPKPVRLALAKALAKKREDRFASCSEFVDALQGGVISGARASSRAFFSRAFVLTAVAALGLAVGGIWYWQDSKEKEESRIAEEQKAEAERKAAEEARRIAEEKAKKEKSETERKQKEEAARIAAERAKAEAEERARKAEMSRNIQESGVSGQGLGKESREDERKAQADRQKEVAELARLSTLITIKIDDAKARMEKVKAYRDETDGFASHLETIDEKWRIFETAEQNPSTVSEAKAMVEKLTDADSIIAQELEWLKTNKSARDRAKAIEREIAGSLEGELNRFKASDYARSTYNDGMRKRKEGNAALNSGDFPKAHEKLTAAKEKLSAAAKEAKAFCIKTHLDSAELFLKSSKWQMCVDEVEKVLKWDVNNAKAIDLKNAALQHLVPSLKVIATIDGEEVRGARLNDGQKDHILPVTWKLEQGKKYGPYKIVFERGGKSYEGRLDAISADWHGLKLQRVALKEDAHDKVQLWEGGPYWADRNIGAEKPEDDGYYFWWGSTGGYKPKFDFWSTSYSFFSKEKTPTSCKNNSELEREGWIENKNGTYVLTSNHDAAQTHWGGAWRMPTKDEFDNLVKKCDWTWTTRYGMRGASGYVVRGRGNYASKSIFLPAAGYYGETSSYDQCSNGYYWSSVRDSYELGYGRAFSLYFDSGDHYTGHYMRSDWCCHGQSVRPVQGFTK